MKTSILNKKILSPILVLGILLLNACDGGDSSKKENKEPEEAIIQIDASNTDDYVYFNLETRKEVEITDPKSSTDWHVGFKRTSIILNGGDAGAGTVKGALAAENTDFYLEDEPIVSAFINAEPKNQLAQFNKAQVGKEITEYIEDTNSLVLDGNPIAAFGPVTTWYNYNFVNHTVSANASNYWIIRSGAGNSYAQFRVTDLSQDFEDEELTEPLSTINSISFEVYFDDGGFSETATEETLDLSAGAVCYDIDLEVEANCEGATWDLYFSPDIDIYLNSGIEGGGNGAAFGPLAAEDLSEFASGASVPHWVADSTSGIFSEEAWYAYNVEGNHKLWSNYNVYAIDTDSSNENSLKVKAQIISYYSSEGASGHYSIRVGEL